MRLQRYVAAVATACSFAQTLAVPIDAATETPVDKRTAGPAEKHIHRLNVEWRDVGEPAANNKYFRKSGMAISLINLTCADGD